MCIFTGKFIWFFGGGEQIELWPKYTIWIWFSMNDREPFQSDIYLTLNIQMLHKCDNYKSIICIWLIIIFDYDFLSDCSSVMHDIIICYVQHSQAMLEHGVCELAHSFFHYGVGYCVIIIVHGGSMFMDFVVTITHGYLTKYELSCIVMQLTSPHKMTSIWTRTILSIH